ncbi:MAG: 50S ribosomal protein L19 [Spirochaetes bacterium]|nr:50S ribosomal protein L19 [Spirochaetota bacterium]
MNELIKEIEKEQMKERPALEPGDTIKVYYKIKEGNKERIQIYEGTIMALKNAGLNRSIIVRKISFGVGVERIFPLYSPRIDKITVIKKGKVRRAKLYYLRDIVGEKAGKIKERLSETRKRATRKKSPVKPKTEAKKVLKRKKKKKGDGKKTKAKKKSS